jgi:hypothetical protein
MRPGMRSSEEGALMPLYLAADPAVAEISGEFFIREGRDGRRIMRLNWDRDTAGQLWNESKALVADWL